MLFLAGNTNKALFSAATLAVLDAQDTITSRCPMVPKAKTKESKKHVGGSNAGNLNDNFTKETMLSEMRVSG